MLHSTSFFCRITFIQMSFGHLFWYASFECHMSWFSIRRYTSCLRHLFHVWSCGQTMKNKIIEYNTNYQWEAALLLLKTRKPNRISVKHIDRYCLPTNCFFLEQITTKSSSVYCILGAQHIFWYHKNII